MARALNHQRPFPDPPAEDALAEDALADRDIASVDRAWDAYISGHPERAITMFDASIEALGTDATPERRFALAYAMLGRGCAYSAAGRAGEAIVPYDEAIRRLGKDPNPDLREQVYHGLLNAAAFLEEQN